MFNEIFDFMSNIWTFSSELHILNFRLIRSTMLSNVWSTEEIPPHAMFLPHPRLLLPRIPLPNPQREVEKGVERVVGRVVEMGLLSLRAISIFPLICYYHKSINHIIIQWPLIDKVQQLLSALFPFLFSLFHSHFNVCPTLLPPLSESMDDRGRRKHLHSRWFVMRMKLLFSILLLIPLIIAKDETGDLGFDCDKDKCVFTLSIPEVSFSHILRIT